jgi:hypothetical protein
MTSTYIPTERDERFDNANLAEKDSMFEQSSRMGFFHYYNSLFWAYTADHFELTGKLPSHGVESADVRQTGGSYVLHCFRIQNLLD